MDWTIYKVAYTLLLRILCKEEKRRPEGLVQENSGAKMLAPRLGANL